MPRVQVSFQKSNPKYYGMPSKSVQDADSEADYKPVGCTRYTILYNYNYTTDKKDASQVSDMDMRFSHKELYVYIDDRYPENSCEYNAIKKHEELHVKTDQIVEINKVENALKKCLSEINKKG
ncbi:MAG: hypothetical protein IJ752_08210 [Alphaproteobacteria bacterium]|nr:hypothetical protein [Alphaproteobacteria bacterium]